MTEMCLRICSLILLSAFALTACQASGSQDGGTGINQAAYARELTARTSPEQQPAFEDGTITREEYEKANYDTMGCMTTAGIEITRVHWLADKYLRFEWSGFNPQSTEGRSMDAVYEGCYAKYSREIDAMWTSLNSPTQQEIDEAIESFIACIRDRGGVDVSRDDVRQSGPADYERLYEIPGYSQCRAVAEQQYGFLPSVRD